MSEQHIVEKVVKYFEDSLFRSLKEDLRTEIRKLVQETVKEEFEAFHRRFNALEKTMDMWKSDLDQDHEDLSNIRRNTGQLAIEAKETSKAIDNLPKKIENTVKDTAKEVIPSVIEQEVPKAVNDTFDVVSKKVKVVEKPKKRWFGWFRKS